MQKITPFLWFDGNAEEAVTFYTSTLKNSRIVNMSRYGEGAPAPKGTVISANPTGHCEPVAAAQPGQRGARLEIDATGVELD